MAVSRYQIATWFAFCLAFSICAEHVRAQAQVYGKTYKVGDNTGWTYINASTGQPVDYAKWAAQYVFFVNDVLEFIYEPNKQNLYSFDSFDAWTSCDFSAAQLLDNGTNGVSQWYLPYEGYYDFASGIYCSAGQKFRIYAVNASSIPFVSPSIPSTADAPDSAPSPDTAPAPSPGGDFPPGTNLPPTIDAPGVAGLPSPPSSASPAAAWAQTLSLLVPFLAGSLAAAFML